MSWERNDLGLSGRWVGWLIRIFPGRLKNDFGDDLLTAFLDQRDEAARSARMPRLAIATTTIRVSWELLKAGVAERMTDGARPRIRSPVRAHLLDDLRHDVHYAVSTLRKSPGFTIIAVLTLALGIGANTAIFSVVSGVLLRPLGYREPDRLVQLVGVRERSPLATTGWVAYQNFLDWRVERQAFESAAIVQEADVTITGGDEPRLVKAALVSPNYFNVLGVSISTGRNFLPEEGERGRARVAVLSEGLWRQAFGANDEVIGGTVQLGGSEYLVVGVAPADFEDPWLDRRSARRPQLWIPLALEGVPADQLPERRSQSYKAIARLQPDVSMAQAQARLDAVTQRLQEIYPRSNTGESVRVVSLQDRLVSDVRGSLLMLFGAVALVLAIATANVAGLVLSRAADREREIAMRTAVGATWSRIARQLLTESVLLAVAGGMLGVAIASAATDALVALTAQDVPRSSGIGVDVRVLAFTGLVTLTVGILCGIAPILQAARNDANGSLRDGSRGSTGGRRRMRVRNAFVVSEVALSLPLLVGAGLLIKSFALLNQVDSGMNPGEVLTFRLNPPPRLYPTRDRIGPLYTDILERVRALPGVRGVTAANVVPLSGGETCAFVSADDLPPPAPGENVCPQNRTVTAEYFRVMGMTIVRGRGFNSSDDVDGRPVIVLNQTLAETFWPGEDAIGRQVTFLDISREVVGVLRDVKHKFLDQAAPPMSYTPHTQEIGTWLTRSMTIVLQATRDPTALMPSVRRAVRSVDPDLSIADVGTMRQIAADSMAQPRFRTLLLAAFAAVALVLAAVGVYGLLSYAASQRSHEMAIRIALGARQSAVRNLIVRQGLRLTAIGMVIGFGGAVAMARLLAGFLFGVTVTDVTTFTAVPVSLLLVATLASYVPARRATKVDAMSVLRQE